jgi:GT2 family glycosyltransferase
MIDAAMFLRHNPDQLFPEDIRFYWQDNFYSEYIKAYGIPHYVIPRSKFVHFESSSSDISTHMQENGDYFLYQSRITKLNSGLGKKP